MDGGLLLGGRPFGLLATSADRTAIDLMRWLPPFMALGAADAITGAGLLTVDQLRKARALDEARRDRLERQLGWRAVIGVGRGQVLGGSMALEYAIGDLLGLEPAIRRRPW